MKETLNNIGCFSAIVIFILLRFFPAVIPSIYDYIVNDIMNGNWQIVVVGFALIDILVCLFLKGKLDQAKENYLKKERALKFDLEHELKKSRSAYEAKVNVLNYEQKRLVDENKEKQLQIEQDFNLKKNELEKTYAENKKELEDIRMRILEDVEHRKDILEELLDEDIPSKKISSMYADLRSLVLDNIADELTSKIRPAYSAAEAVKEARRQLREVVERSRYVEYKYEYLINQFPELKSYVEDYEELTESFEDLKLIGLECDSTRFWLSEEEYNNLSVDERNQLALDRWVNSNHRTNIQIGYEYEMFVGYKYRQAGWKVEQFGIDRGLNDLGRDVVATKIDEGTGHLKTHVIQCKYWGQHKEIHENVINQLYGTTVMYKIQHRDITRVKPILICSTNLSETATAFANALGVIVKIVPMGDFPRIKCNINRNTGEKIYHLPFDQQYYNSQITEPGEFYAWTVDEAVRAGFRRAFKHNM